MSGIFTSSHDLIGIGNGSFTNGRSGNRVGSSSSPLDPRLGPLQDNGGPTFTEALLPGSPAINAGQDGVTAFDQRGVRQPQGAHTDIGAFELVNPAVRGGSPPAPTPVAAVGPPASAPGFPLFSFHLAGRGRHRALIVEGMEFTTGSVVLFDGRPLRTIFVRDTQLLVPNQFGQMRHELGAAAHHRAASQGPELFFILVPGLGMSPPVLV